MLEFEAEGVAASAPASERHARQQGENKDGKQSAKEQIEAGKWVDCWICSEVFGRRRQTARYCNTCERGFCEGEHGSFAHSVGKCVICGARRSDGVQR
jgi:hypothetical protein